MDLGVEILRHSYLYPTDALSSLARLQNPGSSRAVLNMQNDGSADSNPISAAVPPVLYSFRSQSFSHPLPAAASLELI
jgi:hypothetical protein